MGAKSSTLQKAKPQPPPLSEGERAAVRLSIWAGAAFLAVAAASMVCSGAYRPVAVLSVTWLAAWEVARYTTRRRMLDSADTLAYMKPAARETRMRAMAVAAPLYATMMHVAMVALEAATLLAFGGLRDLAGMGRFVGEGGPGCAVAAAYVGVCVCLCIPAAIAAAATTQFQSRAMDEAVMERAHVAALSAWCILAVPVTVYGFATV
jgi:hypothetical protein